MSFMNLIIFVLVSYGLTQILCYGKIFDMIRPTKGKLGELFSCSMCMGFWVGILIWFLCPLTLLFTFDNSLVTGFCLGCISSGTSYFLDKIVSDEGLRLEIKK